eukprot:CAMPEP_0197072038 /NCGR_PEP_ID=MMETSP1384-20130603/209897_1 /TAXON_ID=29189 /ORGANISM="Ammonia sp." /LENGTH=353 /DNA_ID=CAMNT_0042510851 /DNA_START=31 /DNA_END=1089 /DNA_ORIENTATION=+
MGVGSSKKLLELAEKSQEKEAIRLLNNTYLIDPNYSNSKGETALYHACANDLRRLTKALLNFDVDINKRTTAGICALHIATRHGHDHIVSLLLKHPSCDINMETKVKSNALTIGAACNNLPIAHLLLNQATKCRVQDQALLYAALYNDAEMSRVLLNHGANINGSDQDGNTALMQAAALSNDKVVTVLLSREWKPSIDINAQNKYGWSALHFAYAASERKHRKSSVITQLLNKNANMHLNNNAGYKPQEMEQQEFDEVDAFEHKQPARKKRKGNENEVYHIDQKQNQNRNRKGERDESKNEELQQAEEQGVDDSFSPLSRRKNKYQRIRIGIGRASVTRARMRSCSKQRSKVW